MTNKSRSIELDEATAAALRERADEHGSSVPDLVADYLEGDRACAGAGTDQIAELDRRWQRVSAGEATVEDATVVRWLGTWGTPAYKPRCGHQQHG